MSRRRLVLAPEQRRLLEVVARGAAPEECCGILLGHKPGADVRLVTRVVETENATTGDRERSYEIAPSELVAAWRLARAAGETILGFYHSHPGGRCRPSSHDEVLAWNGMSYVIVAPGEGRCRLTSWRCEGAGSESAGQEPDRARRGLEREEIRVERRWGGLA